MVKEASIKGDLSRALYHSLPHRESIFTYICGIQSPILISRRQIAKRLNTSLPQLYRLLDSANTRKSMNQLVTLLHVLNCNVDMVVKKKAAA